MSKKLPSLSDLLGFFKRLPAQINAMPSNRRVLFFVLALLVILFVWVIVFLLPVRMYTASMKAERLLLLKQITILNDKARLIVEDAATNENTLNSNKHKSLQQKLKELDEMLVVYKNELIPADQMSRVLKNLIASADGLKLVQLKSLPAEQIKNKDKDLFYQGMKVYRRPISVTFTGNFNDIYAYLRQVEHLPWRFFWSGLTYRVDKYPRATVVLVLETLSTSEGPAQGDQHVPTS